MAINKTWVVVAHQEQARIFSHDRAGDGVRLLRSIDHPEGRLKIHERVSDRPGRKFRPSDQNRGNVTTPILPDEKDAIDFARKVAKEINLGRSTQLYQNAVIVAGPHFLGLIRGFLDRRTQDCVVATVSKNLGKHNEREISQELLIELSDADRAAVLAA